MQGVRGERHAKEPSASLGSTVIEGLAPTSILRDKSQVGVVGRAYASGYYCVLGMKFPGWELNSVTADDDCDRGVRSSPGRVRTSKAAPGGNDPGSGFAHPSNRLLEGKISSRVRSSTVGADTILC